MTVNPENINAMLPQILADPEAVNAMQVLAAREGISTPVAELAREKQVELVTQLIGMAQAAQAQSGGAGAPGDRGGIPDEIVEQVFADPRADEILRQIMSGNELSGEPADLPLEIKRAIVQMMVDQGVISFGQP